MLKGHDTELGKESPLACADGEKRMIRELASLLSGKHMITSDCFSYESLTRLERAGPYDSAGKEKFFLYPSESSGWTKS